MGININEMNESYERNKYWGELERIVRSDDKDRIYHFLLNEYAKGNLKKYEAQTILHHLRERIPLRNQLGELTTQELFYCERPTGYFDVDLLKMIMIHPECTELAQFIGCSSLSEIYSKHIIWNEKLTEDDFEALIDDYFSNSAEIIMQFYKKGQITDELLTAFNLGYLAYNAADSIIDQNEYEFPGQTVCSQQQLKAHIAKLWKKPARIISVKVERTIQRVQTPDGTTFDLNSNEARESALRKYTPDGAPNMCFCQMCRHLKPYRSIEVNNIESRPRFYFPQTRVALCLECSKTFEELRGNPAIYNKYMDSILNTEITEDDEVITIPIAEIRSLSFSARHLAEIQEILTQAKRRN